MKKTSIKLRKITLCAIGMISIIQFGFGLFLIMGTPMTQSPSQTSASTSAAQNTKNAPLQLPKFAALEPKDS